MEDMDWWFFRKGQLQQTDVAPSVAMSGQLVVQKLFIQPLKPFVSPQLQKPNEAYDAQADGTKPATVITSNLCGLNSL